MAKKTEKVAFVTAVDGRFPQWDLYRQDGLLEGKLIGNNHITNR
jgi:hypothetical protein